MSRKMLASGAEANVYRQSVLGLDAIAKERIRKAYRIEELDTHLRLQRTKTEARILALLAERGLPVPGPLLADGDTLYMEYVDGTRMSLQLDSLPRGDALAYMLESGRLLGRIHNAGVSHGDYTPANLIIADGRVHAIDFGLSAMTKSAEDMALDLLLMKRSVTRGQYAGFLKGYSETAKRQKEIMGRLAEIELRGRYQSRSLATA